MIGIKNLTVQYQEGTARHTILEDVNFSLPTGGTCAIIGPSGCGKSTLLKVLAGILHEFSGAVQIDGKNLDPASRKIGFIPQTYGLLPWRTAEENICLAAKIKNPGRPDREALAKLIDLLGLHGLERRYPSELSGGQQQRVSLARAFFLRPDLLLLDEPFSALDAITREEMQDVLLSLWQKYAVTTVFVTHYVEEAIYLGQKIVVLASNPGRVQAVLDNPLFGARDARQQEAFFAMGLKLRDFLRREGRGHAKA